VLPTQPQQLKKPEAAGEFQPSSLAQPLRLVCDTATLRGQCQDAPSSTERFGLVKSWEMNPFQALKD
jgi:hypothetical protein